MLCDVECNVQNNTLQLLYITTSEQLKCGSCGDTVQHDGKEARRVVPSGLLHARRFVLILPQDATTHHLQLQSTQNRNNTRLKLFVTFEERPSGRR